MILTLNILHEQLYDINLLLRVELVVGVDANEASVCGGGGGGWVRGRGGDIFLLEFYL